MRKFFSLPLTFYGISYFALVSFSMNPDYPANYNHKQENPYNKTILEIMEPVSTLAKKGKRSIKIEKMHTGGFKLTIVNSEKMTVDISKKTYEEICSYNQFSEECGILKVKEKGTYTFIFINIEDQENPIKNSCIKFTNAKKICWLNNQGQGFTYVQQQDKWELVYINLKECQPTGITCEDVKTIDLIKENEGLACIKKDGIYEFAFIKFTNTICSNCEKQPLANFEIHYIKIGESNILDIGKIFFCDKGYGLTWIQTDENEYKFFFIDCVNNHALVKKLDIKFKMINNDNIYYKGKYIVATVLDEEKNNRIIVLDCEKKTHEIFSSEDFFSKLNSL